MRIPENEAANYHIDVDEKMRLVTCVWNGDLNVESAKSITKEIRKMAYELGYRALYELRRL